MRRVTALDVEAPMIAHHHSFASMHPWLTAMIVWLTLDIIVVCGIMARSVRRRASRYDLAKEAHRPRSNN